MSLNFSTGLRTGMLNSTGVKEAFTNGIIYLYSGVQPVTADAAITGTLLGKVTVDAGAFAFGAATNGLNFDTAVAGVLAKAVAENWQCVCTAAGTIGWFRMMGNATDALGVSTTLARIDGDAAVSGADLNIPTLAVIIGTPITIDVFTFDLPA